jgi:hypothetical protein
LESISSPVLQRKEKEADSMISYTDFLGAYWGHFPQSLTKGLGWFLNSFLGPC